MNEMNRIYKRATIIFSAEEIKALKNALNAYSKRKDIPDARRYTYLAEQLLSIDKLLIVGNV